MEKEGCLRGDGKGRVSEWRCRRKEVQKEADKEKERGLRGDRERKGVGGNAEKYKIGS